jgi:hypothetical protein
MGEGKSDGRLSWPRPPAFDMTPDVTHRELTMYGSWTFNPLLMAECARFAVDRRVAAGRVFTDTFTPERETRPSIVSRPVPRAKASLP